MIPYGRQSVTEEDIDAVVDVLRSDFLTQGPIIPKFEYAIASRFQVAHGVATNSATSALHLACMALGLEPGDSLWTTPISFVASSNCGLYCGATIDFVDIDPITYNLSVDSLSEKLSVAKKKNCLPKIVVPVHMAGQSCDMDAIYDLSKKYGFHIIEDASHALGGTYKGKPVGSCQYSDITVFSFHPVKIITTGEGGMALTNDVRLAEKMRLMRSHGITRDPSNMTKAPHGAWYYQQITLGYNYRMTDIQAALGISQLKRLPEVIGVRTELAMRYDKYLSGLSLDTPRQLLKSESAWHLYIVRLKIRDDRTSHRRVFDFLRDSGIGVNLHYIPIYLQPHYQAMGFTPGLCPEAEAYYGEAISLPIFPGLSTKDQDKVVECLGAALK